MVNPPVRCLQCGEADAVVQFLGWLQCLSCAIRWRTRGHTIFPLIVSDADLYEQQKLSNARHRVDCGLPPLVPHVLSMTKKAIAARALRRRRAFHEAPA